MRDDTLLQFQADILGVPSCVRSSRRRPRSARRTPDLAVGFWSGLDELAQNWQEDRRWTPAMDEAERERLDRNWKKAVTKTLEWVDEDVA